MTQMTTCDLHNETIIRLQRELAAANARVEEYRKALRRIEQALLPDPHDERELSVHWVRGAIGTIIATIAAKEKPNES